MDERLKKALEISNLSTVIANQKKLLRDKFHHKNVIYKNGGTFTISYEFINFAQNAVNREQDSLVFLDDNGLPILIEDVSDFVDELYDIYFTSLNQYYNDYQALVKNRSVEKIANE